MNHSCLVVCGVVLLAGCSAIPPIDVEQFIDQGFGATYSDAIISNPDALTQTLGPAQRKEATAFDASQEGGYDQVETFVFKTVAAEYYTYKQPDGRDPKYALKSFRAVPGIAYSDLTIGMTEGDVRKRIPGLGAKDYWLSSAAFHEVAFDFKGGKLEGIVWTLSSE